MIAMIIVVQFIGLIIFVCGIFFILSPAAWRRFLLFWKERWYQSGVVSALIAICFFVTAPAARWPWVIIGIGALYLLEVILTFAWGSERGSKVIEEALNDSSSRWVSAIANLASGVAVILAFK
ncbi:MAG: hypothetical protein AAGB97_04200 [Dehalococcoidia bacterium]|nr:hypothetical protein [Chloroflexota bacterium]MBT9159189.1 hypothetical protein [Chloroflexota bacterium]MBT9161879.1 hypothetical protein [Chloroflexota bacterium]